jgi:hypothetical protein
VGLVFYELGEILIPDLRLEIQLLAIGRDAAAFWDCRSKGAQARVPVPLNPIVSCASSYKNVEW